MISAIILDDELKARNTLLKMVKEHCPQIEVTGTADSSETAYVLISEQNPQLLFLDIEISNEKSPETSFDLLRRLPKYDFEVIFVTAFDKYAVQAFQFSAIGYLLKPFGIEDLIETVKRAEENLRKKGAGQRIEDLLLKIQGTSNSVNRIWIHSQNEILPIPVNDIVYLEAQGKYTKFCCINGKHALSSKNLGEFVDMMEAQGFIKTHRSYIINPNMIAKYDKTNGGSLAMKNNQQLPVSRAGRKRIIALT